eukprot:254756-Pleurochrysis_carterae.AAC.2
MRVLDDDGDGDDDDDDLGIVHCAPRAPSAPGSLVSGVSSYRVPPRSVSGLGASRCLLCRCVAALDSVWPAGMIPGLSPNFLVLCGMCCGQTFVLVFATVSQV